MIAENKIREQELPEPHVVKSGLDEFADQIDWSKPVGPVGGEEDIEAPAEVKSGLDELADQLDWSKDK